MRIDQIIWAQCRGFQVYGKTKHGLRKYNYSGLVSAGFGLHEFTDEDGNKYFVQVNSYNNSLMTINPWGDHLLCIGNNISFKLKLKDRILIFIKKMLRGFDK